MLAAARWWVNAMGKPFEELQREVVDCRRCPRLVAWREQVAEEKKRAYRDWNYWGRPVPSFGDPAARLVVLGLAPAAHGANRTGRMFTGDSSGVWLYRALWKAGFANQAECERADDGLELRDCVLTAAARCAPPDNKPTREEFAACSGWLDRELALLGRAQVVVALGQLAWDAYLGYASRAGSVVRPKPQFGHLALVGEGLPHVLLGSYHPSRQNTNTGKLTEPMLDAVFAEARRLLR